MANPARILFDNVFLRASLTASSELANAPGINLTTHDKAYYWGCTAASNRTISGVLAANESINCFAIPFCNCSSAATFRLQLFSGTNYTGNLYDSGTISPFIARANVSPNLAIAPNTADGFSFGNFSEMNLHFNAVSGVRSFIVTISDSANPSGAIHVGNMVLGNAIILQRRPNIGLSMGFESTSQFYRTKAGSGQALIEPRSKFITFDMGGLSEAERKVYVEVFRKVSNTLPIYFSCFPMDADKEKENDYSIYGFLEPSSLIKLTSCPRSTTSLKLLST